MGVSLPAGSLDDAADGYVLIVLRSAVRSLRATGADLPFGAPSGAHPGVALESWSWRLVDATRGQVLLLAVTAVGREPGHPWASVVLAVQHADGTQTVEERRLSTVRADPERLRLEADGVDGCRVRVGPDELEVDLGPTARLHVTFDAPWHWPRRSLGGLGLGHVVPGLTQYWHPHLLGAEVRGGAEVGGRALQLDGALAYGEKNWGRGGTPRAWWWGQATCGPELVVSFAGGVLDIGPGRIPATALALRVGDELVAASPPLAVLATRARPGRWAIDVRTPRWRVRLRASASNRPLDLPVPVPGESRTALLSHQHQDGVLELEAWRDGRLRARGTTVWAGLERGGHDLRRATGGAPDPAS